MRKILTVRNVCLTLMFTLVLACASVFFALMKTPTAHADEGQAQDVELGEIAVTYIVGDESIVGTYGAVPVNGDSDTYGWYTYNSVTNTYAYSDIVFGWTSAMNAPSSADSRVKVVLGSDWTAQATDATASDGTSLVTAFGLNDSAFYHGGLYIPDGMNLQLDLNGKVLNRAASITASTYGSVIYCGNCNLEITDSDVMSDHDGLYDYERTFTNEDGETVTENIVVLGGLITGGASIGSSSADCHGINMANGGQLVISAGTVINNRSGEALFTPYGGGISGNSCTIIMTGGAILNNQVKGQAGHGGGGIYLSQGTIDIRGGIISDNSSRCYGGGVHLGTGYFLMSGGEISYNSSTSCSAGVHIGSTSIVTIDGGKIIYNVVTGNGGNGGGLYFDGGSSIATMNGGEISYNRMNSGGGVYIKYCTFTMNGGEISGNTVSQDGGGVCISDNAEFIMNGGKISGNSSSTNGGGVICMKQYSGNSAFIFNGGEISDNTASNYGGGVYISEDAKFIMSGGKISNNISKTCDGGGVYVTANSTFTMSSGEICENRAQMHGSGVYIDSGSFNVSGNPIITDNELLGIYGNGIIENVHGTINVIGEFTEGAKIGVFYEGIITADYAKYNSEDGYIKDPAKIFFVDNVNCGIALTKAGEAACITEIDFEFKAGYGEEPEPDVIDGLVATYGYKGGNKAGYEITNGKTAQITFSKVLKDGVEHNGDIVGAGVYEIVYRVNGSSATYEIVFAIVITPANLADENITIELDQASFAFDGEAKTPSIVGKIEYNGVELVEDTDYTVTYENNVYAGTGYVVIDFIGNYCGQKKVSFTIDIDGGYYQTTWQYYNGKEWKNISSDNLFTFIPGIYGNQSNRVRVMLESAGGSAGENIVKYAYAQGVREYLDRSLVSGSISGYYIEYTLNESVVDFRAAGEYSLSIKNNGTETLPLNNNELELIDGKTLKINSYSISDNDAKLEAAVLEECVYSGVAQQPQVSVVYDNLELEIATDFRVEYYDNEHSESAINGGTAYARIVFMGNYSGEKVLTFDILSAENEWLSPLNIERWYYGAFDPQTAFIVAQPKYILDNAVMGVSILSIDGKAIEIDGVSLSYITVERVFDEYYGWCFVVADEDVAAAINKLDVARYTLRVWLDASQSYSELNAEEITFNVLKSANYWDEAPSIAGWTAGEFSEEHNLPNAKAHFGGDNVRIVIVDVEDESIVYYDSANGINRLYDLDAGVYYLTATVEGNDNYTALSQSAMFRVLENRGVTVINQGLPWWAVLLIVLAVVVVFAAVILVLHIKGVFQIITGKMVIAMRSRADVDATIAAVRAGRIAAAAESSSAVSAENPVAQAKEQAKTEKKAKALEKKAKTPEEKAAELEAKAKAMRKRAEDMKAKAKNAELKAAAMVMTPEEKAEAKAREKEEQERRVKAKTPEARAEILEEKARLAEEHAENLKARAEVMKSRASEMREKAAAQAEREKAKAEKEQAEKAKAEKEQAEKATEKAKPKAKAKKKVGSEPAENSETPTPEKQAETTATIENEEE